MRYLEDPTLKVSHIAWLLGYSEVTSFNHAFQRWTSSNPKAVWARLASVRDISILSHRVGAQCDGQLPQYRAELRA
jgi:AraC-like DNA-binding protein